MPKLLASDVTRIAEAVHNAERWDLGKASTRDHRNAYWARVIGIVHHGHAVYNPQGGDPRWGLKKASATLPQSDDVAAILMTTDPADPYKPRDAWDFIVGAGGGVYSPTPQPGSGNYWFHEDYLGQLPAIQVIYAPPRPDGVQPGPSPCDQRFPPRDEGLAFYVDLNAEYQRRGRPNTSADGYPPLYVDIEGTAVWYAEYLRLRVGGLSHAAASADVMRQLDAAWPK